MKISAFKFLRPSWLLPVILIQTSTVVHALELNNASTGVSLSLDEPRGIYQITSSAQHWDFSGQLPAACKNVRQNSAVDSLGNYREATFDWQEPAGLMTGSIRLYASNSVVLFSETCTTATTTLPTPFPDFQKVPAHLHVFSYRQATFAPPTFTASETSTPWLLFDDRDRAVIISPAAHFMVASMLGDGQQRVASGFNPQLRAWPAGFTAQTIMTFGAGINHTWDIWGQSLNEFRGAKRPPNDADTILKYFGYWTDNGAAYYYNYDPQLGYAGTLQALVEHDRQTQIPIRYLQLDSWWYYKTFTDADGSIGKTKQPKLPVGEWNRYGGLLEYKAHPFLFTNGLAAFQKTTGLPFVTHNRWIDPASPYHDHYQISGIAAIDPKWWDAIADYMQSCGIVTYEQDWLDRIYKYSPAFSSNAVAGAAFLGEMARACREHGITMQYCMPYPGYFLEGSRYENLTTIRTSDDRFEPGHWNDFLYTSRLASALGIWPWSDVFKSPETNNFLLSTLSAGPVGIGDAMGAENVVNISKAVRADGIIVKPDAPCVPMDQSYLADVRHEHKPLLAATYTDHAGWRTSYIFAWNRNRTNPETAQFSPRELGCDGKVIVYDTGTGSLTPLSAHKPFEAALPAHGTGFYIVAPVGRSDMAFFGDLGKFVSTGKQRISEISDEPDRLTVNVLLAPTESSVVLHGFAPKQPSISVENGTAGPLQFAAASHHFQVAIFAPATSGTATNPPVALRVTFVTGDVSR